MVQLMPLHPQTPSSLASFKSRMVLSFWYRLTQVVLEKRPLNWCSVVVVVVVLIVVGTVSFACYCAVCSDAESSSSERE